MVYQSATGKFGATTAGLRKLSAWLSECGMTHLAIESTGALWVRVWRTLEGQFKLLLVNPQ